MSDETTPEVPPEETPDEGMGTAREEWEAQPESDPQTDADFGMSAGYPIITDEAIPMDPGEPPEEIEPPPEEALRDAPPFSEAAFDLPGPDSGSAPQPREDLDASPEMVEVLVTDDDLKALWARADRAQTLVHQQVKSLGIARELLDLIKAARNEILAGKDHYEEAERLLSEVEYRVGLTAKMAEWTRVDGVRLFTYEMIWGILSFSILFFWMIRGGDAVFLANNANIVYFVGCMMWGGIGGVIGALISLVKHIAIDQDFDRQHTLWYIASPLVGYGVGAVIFVIISAGLISLTGPGEISSPFIMYVLAWLSGYQQNVFTDILKRILKLFEIGDKEEE